VYAPFGARARRFIAANLRMAQQQRRGAIAAASDMADDTTSNTVAL